MKCRHCATELTHTFLDLGFAPPSNAYLNESDLSKPEKYYPLKIKVCDKCWLVQTEDYAQADELFSARRITIAPLLIVVGYIVIMVAIMKRKKANKGE
jgi:hypothetical protein